ncbi:MAG: cysteine--tRNA ligase [Alphaproteobacteria bacterium]|nr:cysteine--tRNA ligase [Alphaproteobacteria bacterium]
MKTLYLHDSLTRTKGAFTPLDPKHVRLYACGPTVYSYAHIGNARMAVTFDLLAGILRTLYPKVTYVSNITDVDDKIITASLQTGESCAAITDKYAAIYNHDMARLGLLPPDIQPRATGHIPQMIALIQTLIEKEHAYEAQGHVLFNVPSFPAYGALSGRNRDDQIAGARVEVAPYKKDPADFVLWKPSAPDQPGWDSPWGFGRPGWHIECSAMAQEHLGLPFDIHGGGADLKFPHHENEIAQSCCARGAENDPSAFSKIWVHNGFVTVEGEKMSKSLGNVALVHDLLKEWPGEVLRLALLSAHYRQPLDWSDNLLRQIKSFLDGLYRTLYEMRNIEPDYASAPTAEIDAVLEALYDDLNTPKAIAALSHINKAASLDKSAHQKGILLRAGSLLGILKADPVEWLGYGVSGADIDSSKIERLIQERKTARAEKNYRRADEIRDELDAMGLIIEDTPGGAKWRRRE